MDIKILLSDIAETTEAFDVSGLSLNTKTLTKGDLFIALQGEKNHGAEYIDSAIENGCIGVLIEGKMLIATSQLSELTTSSLNFLGLLKISTPKQRMLISLQSRVQMVRRLSVITFHSY